MRLTPSDVRHIARLARISLTPSEEERFAQQMSDFLAHVDKLDELDLTNVPETNQVTGLTNSMREDTALPFMQTDALLHQSRHPIIDQQIAVNKSI